MTGDDGIVLECGRTIEELSTYLDNGRTPRDPDIENCPECLNALEALERVGQLSRDLIADEAVHLPALPEGWFQGILTAVRAEVGTGRSLPVQHPDPRVRITVTEGAVRSLLRAAGDSIDGLFVGRTEIVGDADVPGAPVQVRLTATAAWDRDVTELAERLRTRVYRVLAEHTELNVTAVDVDIVDVHGYDPADTAPPGSPGTPRTPGRDLS